MRIIIVVAMSDNRVIGYRNKLPWHMPEDLRRFKTVTMDKPILMGRSTYESIGHPLQGRCNIVITRDPELRAPGCVVANSIECALEAAAYSEEIYIIGGASLYEHLIPRAQRIYLTQIHHHFEGDTFFPELDMSQWREVERETHQPDENNAYPYTFLTLDRVELL